MERFTISLDDDLARQFDALLERTGHANRSEAIRDLIRDRLEAERRTRAEGACVASLSYIYDHQARQLAARLTQAQHDHHDLTIATVHIHIDHDTCMETVMLRGPMAAVRAFADRVLAQAGVRHGQLHVVPAAESVEHHHHGTDRPHGHWRPLS